MIVFGLSPAAGSAPPQACAVSCAYAGSALAGEYARAVVGLGLVGLPLLLAETAPALTVFLVSSALLFACYAARTMTRHLSRIEVTDDEVCARGPIGVDIPWRDLTGLRLRYYSTRRDRSAGWMHLVLSGRGRRRLQVDSRLEGFDHVARCAVAAALRNGVRLDTATAYNIEALGLEAGEGRSAGPIHNDRFGGDRPVAAQARSGADLASAGSYLSPSDPSSDRATDHVSRARHPTGPTP